MYGMDRRRLRLVPHDSGWSQDFPEEKQRILKEPTDPTVEVEQVGSTSIPHLHAKPILDLAILCGEKRLQATIQGLNPLGYEYRRPYGDIDGHYYAVLDREHVRYCQAHICTAKNSEGHSKIRSRDVLRRRPELAREDNDCKRALAATTPDKSLYAEIKGKCLEGFLQKVLPGSQPPKGETS